MTSQWTAEEISAAVNDYNGDYISEFHVPLRYVYVRLSDDTDVNLVKSKIKSLHTSLVYDVFAARNLGAPGPETKTTPRIFFSANSTIPDDHVTDVIKTDFGITSATTLQDIIVKMGTDLPSGNDLVLLIVEKLNINGVPISHFDTHDLTSENMISRVGIVSADALGIEGIDGGVFDGSVYNKGHLLVHVLGHMLGLPHTFEYGKCDAHFTTDSPSFSNKLLSEVHGGGFASQQYDNLWVNDLGFGSNRDRKNSTLNPKPFDLGKVSQIIYSCDRNGEGPEEGFNRFMDVAPDNVTSYFTENNVKLMRENLMRYDLNKGIATNSAKKVFDLSIVKQKKTTTTDTTTTNNNTVVKPPPVQPAPAAKSTMSIGVIVGIAVGSAVGVLLLVAAAWWFRKRFMKSKEEATAAPAAAPVEPSIVAREPSIAPQRAASVKPERASSVIEPPREPSARAASVRPERAASIKPERVPSSKPVMEPETLNSAKSSDLGDLNFEGLDEDLGDLDDFNF